MFAFNILIETWFQIKLKISVELIELSTVYDILWRRSLLHKIIKVISYSKLTILLYRFQTKHRFYVHICMKLSVVIDVQLTMDFSRDQFWLQHCLYYTSTFTKTKGLKCQYAYENAIAHPRIVLKDGSQTLSEDMLTMNAFKTKSIKGQGVCI